VVEPLEEEEEVILEDATLDELLLVLEEVGSVEDEVAEEELLNEELDVTLGPLHPPTMSPTNTLIVMILCFFILVPPNEYDDFFTFSLP